jgi:RNA polymerase sigma-70 factor (ECF subfamily)
LDSARVREIERVFRAEHGRAVAVLTRVFGDIGVAEDAVADAFVVAVERWPEEGLPPSPAGWIITTARNRAIDRLRREASRADRHAQAVLLHAADEPLPEETGPVADERLRLIFTCCHPALNRPAQVALTLRLLGGLSTAEIARAFLVPEATMAQRLVRARARSATQIPTACPRRTICPAAFDPFWPSSTSSSTRATRRARGPSSSGATSAPRRCAWRACSPSSCPTRRR